MFVSMDISYSYAALIFTCHLSVFETFNYLLKQVGL